MDHCPHGMDLAWCYVCRIESSGVDPRAAWGLDEPGDDPGLVLRSGPMTTSQGAELRFLCEEFGFAFDEGLTEAETAVVIAGFRDDVPTESQRSTLAWLAEHTGEASDGGSTYGQARTRIRRLVALKGLKSA